MGKEDIEQKNRGKVIVPVVIVNSVDKGALTHLLFHYFYILPRPPSQVLCMYN